MNIDDILNERFSALKLTLAINKRQNEYGLLNSLGIFSEKGIADRQVKIETKESTISIIATSPIGTPAPADDDPDRREVRILPTFRHAKLHTLLAEEVQGVRAFGSDDSVEVYDVKYLEKIDKIQREHRQTKEYLRWSALKGDVLDPDGSRVLYNSYAAMGEAQKTIEWDIADGESVDAIADGNDELLDYLETEALGETVTGVVKFCSPGYMTAMNKNKDFREAYRYFASQQSEVNPNRQLLRKPFHFKGVDYVRHMGQCSFKKKDGSVVTYKFIPDNEAICVPTGTTETFQTFFGPGEFADTVNTIGKEIYIRPEKMKLNMGVELHSFSYQLNLVAKPRLVVRARIKAPGG